MGDEAVATVLSSNSLQTGEDRDGEEEPADRVLRPPRCYQHAHRRETEWDDDGDGIGSIQVCEMTSIRDCQSYRCGRACQGNCREADGQHGRAAVRRSVCGHALTVGRFRSWAHGAGTTLRSGWHHRWV